MMKILVIEDNDGMREEIVDILRFEGYEAREAENGRVGLEIVKAWTPDLVICDLMMPELDGYATLEAIRAHAPLGRDPVPLPDGARRAPRHAEGDGARGRRLPDQALHRRGAARRGPRGARQGGADGARLRGPPLRPDGAALDGAAHELRTPLNCILGYAELLGNDADARSRPRRWPRSRSASSARGSG